MVLDLFFCQSFRTFYENQIDLIRKGIFDFYSGLGRSLGEEEEQSPLTQIIEMQKDRILELERKLEFSPSSQENEKNNEKNEYNKLLEIERTHTNERIEELNTEIADLSTKICNLESNLLVSLDRNNESELSVGEIERSLKEAERSLTLLTESLSHESDKNKTLESKVLSLEVLLSDQTKELYDRNLDLDSMMRSEAVVMSEAESLRRRAEVAEKSGIDDFHFYACCSCCYYYFYFYCCFCHYCRLLLLLSLL